MGAPEIPVFTAGGTDALPPPVADHEAGALVLKNLLPPETLTALHTAYAAHYKEVTDRTTGSYQRGRRQTADEALPEQNGLRLTVPVRSLCA